MKKLIKNCLLFVLSLSICFSGCFFLGCQDTNDKKYIYNGKTQKVVSSGIYLVENGVSKYSVLLRENYDKAEAYAAEEFNRLLQEASGINLPIVTQATSDSTRYISIGTTSISEAAGVAPKTDKYTRNGFYIKSYKNALIINAPQRSGLIYGVYRFFEKNCDYMYYDKDTFKINRSETIELLSFDFEDWPDFLNRDVFSYGMKSDPAHTMRLYNTGGQYSKWDEKYGEGSWWATSLDDQSFISALLRYSVYGEKYPKWFVKKTTNAQLCYTEGLYSKDEYEKGDFSEENYADGKHGMFWTLVYNLIHNHIMVEQDKSVFMLGMADNNTYCDCDRCKRDVAIYEKSGVCIRFLNAVAKEVEKWRLETCPEREIYLSVFAYQDLTIPPVDKVNGEYVPIDESVVVEDNILLRYAPAYDYYLFPLMDEEHNPGSTEALLGWTALAKNLAVWDYRVAYIQLVYPFPNWLSSFENIKNYKKLGFIDILSQGPSQFDGTPFLSMDNWIRSRLLWDSTLDYDSLLQEFTDAYYGEAGEYIREYIDYLTVHYLTYMMDLGRYANPQYPEQINAQYFPRGVINNIEYIFNKMYAAIEPYREKDVEKYEKLKLHIDQESTFYRYCQIELYRSFYTTSDTLAMIDEFERIQQTIGLRDMHTVYNSFQTIIAQWREEIANGL